MRLLTTVAVLALLGPAGAQEMALNPLSSIAPDDLVGFRERPLFAPSRRPPQPPAEPEAIVAAADPEPPNLQLIGIIRVEDRAVAIANDLDGGVTIALELDDVIREWTVRNIESASIRLRSGEHEADLILFDPNQPDRTAAPSAGRSTPSPDRDRAALADASSDTLLKILRGEITITER